MPGIPQTIADELLPLIFRRPRRSPVIGNDLPEQGGYGGNMLAPQDPAAPVTIPSGMQPSQVAMLGETRPRATQPAALSAPLWDRSGNPINRDLPANTWDEKVPTVDPASMSPPSPPTAAPNVLNPVSRSGQTMDETAVRGRRVETDKRSRPTPNITLQGDEQTLDYNSRLARMPEDTAGGGWWPRIRAALAGFAAGGPVGAASAFGTRALREHFDPTLGSREYKRDKMAQNAPAVEQIRQARKDRLDENAKVASTDLAKARTDALKNPRQSARIIERKDGVWMLNPKTNKFEKVQEIPPEAGAANAARYFKAGNGEVWKIDAEHPEGVKVRNIPGSPGKDTEDVGFSNAKIQQAITEAQAEQKKIDEGLVSIPRTIQSTDILGNPRTIANPDYTYNMTRRRQLDDDIRNWRLKLKSSKKGAASATSSSDPLGILDDEDEGP